MKETEIRSQSPKRRLLANKNYFVGFCFFILFSTLSLADQYTRPFENHLAPHKTLTFEPGFQFFSTKENYGPSGSLTTPSNLKSYTRFGFDLLSSYGLNPRVSAFARLTWQKNEISHNTLSGSAYGFGDSTLGFTLRILRSNPNPFSKKAVLDFQFQTDIPFYSNKQSNQNNTPFLGDGSYDLTGGLLLNLPLFRSPESSWLVLGGSGITWRSAGFSASVPWSLAVQYVQSEQFFAEIGGYGFYSLKTDPNGKSGNIASAGSGGGGSFVINAINPSLAMIRGQLGYNLNEDVGFKLALSNSVWGQAAPSGLNVLFGMTARWHFKKYNEAQTPISPKKLTPQEYGKSNQGFLDYAFEAKVVRMSDRLNLVKINKGSQDGIEVGQIFDIFSIKKDGTVNEIIARSECTHVKPNEAALKITEYFKEVWIEEGFIAKRPLP
ncbi:MAG: hypothetical protein HY843_03580 [Bdellovibrio sp.]|nr:hypothetical protein [Bdellovibrio sp.]